MAGAEPTNERPSLCAECGGQCCRSRPGVEAVERFLAAADPVAALGAALASGDWVLADHVGLPWTDGVPPPEPERRRLIRYPRPATAAERGSGRASSDPAASPCVFLGEAGCRLAFADRPRMCRSLEPAVGFECEAAWDRLAAARDWAPWQAMVEAALGLAGRGARGIPHHADGIAVMGGPPGPAIRR
jgi:Fe-S-cluster containining protein